MAANKQLGREFIGQVHGDKCRIAIVVGRFNDAITERLLRGAMDTLVRHQVNPGHIDTVWVPGAFEIPLTAWRLGRSGHYDAVICLGAVIRGSTPHFDLVANQAASGIAQVALQCDLPVIFGVLTCDTIEQAVERAGTKAGNKGADAAMAALEMVQLLRTLPRSVESMKEKERES